MEVSLVSMYVLVLTIDQFYCLRHAVGRSENPWGGGSDNLVGVLCPLVEIGLTDLPKSGGAAAW
jgi:hypothetical protein